MPKLSKILIYLILLNGLFLSYPLLAADCSISYVQDTTISADCDGFNIDRNLDFDLSIDDGVTVSLNLFGSPFASDNVIGIQLDMSGVFTNDGTINANGGTTALYIEGATVNSIINNSIIESGRDTITIGSTINSIENTGDISATSSIAIKVFGSINLFTNSGTISADRYTVAILSTGTLTSLINTGRISSSGFTVDNSGTLNTITNSGTISSGSFSAIFNRNGNIETITNTSDGAITGGSDTITNLAGLTITSLINQGDIDASTDAAILNEGTISTLNNSGNIYAMEGIGIENDGASGSITNLTNSGNISAGTAISNTTGSIETITNTGSIS